MDTMVFVYHNPDREPSVVHLMDRDGETACGSWHGEYGEYLFSDREYDRELAVRLGIDLSVVTCEKCANIGREEK